MLNTPQYVVESILNNPIEYVIEQQNLNYNQQIKTDCEVKVLSTGMYIINMSCQFDEACKIGLFINHLEDSTYETVQFNNLLVHQIVFISQNDTINFKYLSDYPNKTISSENKIKLWKL